MCSSRNLWVYYGDKTFSWPNSHWWEWEDVRKEHVGSRQGDGMGRMWCKWKSFPKLQWDCSNCNHFVLPKLWALLLPYFPLFFLHKEISVCLRLHCILLKTIKNMTIRTDLKKKATIVSNGNRWCCLLLLYSTLINLIKSFFFNKRLKLYLILWHFWLWGYLIYVRHMHWDIQISSVVYGTGFIKEYVSLMEEQTFILLPQQGSNSLTLHKQIEIILSPPMLLVYY